MDVTTFVRVLLWIVFFVAIFAAARGPESRPIWLRFVLYGVGFAAIIAYQRIGSPKQREARRQAARWLARYNALADAHDVDNDGHIDEWLTPEEWDRVFTILERLPPGRRSLQSAMKEVDPSIEF